MEQDYALTWNKSTMILSFFSIGADFARRTTIALRGAESGVMDKNAGFLAVADKNA